MAGFGFGFIEVAGSLGFKFPFNKLRGFPNTCVYDALCVLMFGFGLGMVGWMAEFRFGFVEAAVWLGCEVSL